MIKGEGRLCNSEAPGVIYTIQRFYPTAPGYLSPSSRHPTQSCYDLKISTISTSNLSTFPTRLSPSVLVMVWIDPRRAERLLGNTLSFEAFHWRQTLRRRCRADNIVELFFEASLYGAVALIRIIALIESISVFDGPQRGQPRTHSLQVSPGWVFMGLSCNGAMSMFTLRKPGIWSVDGRH